MRLRSSLFCLAVALSASLALAQTPPTGVTTPPPVETAPVQPPAQGGPAADQNAPPSPQPAPQAQTPGPAPAQPAMPAQPQAPAATARSTLFPNPGDPVNVDEGVLVAKPTAVLPGTSTWDDGFTNLKAAFAKIEAELRKAGVAPAGRPLTVFVHTDDMGFRYEAMIPIAQVPEGRSELTPEIKFGKTPEGKSFRFVHKDAYDEIDGTYETITAYLDAKNIESKDAFVEEYVTDLTESSDAGLEVNIYVQPKE